MPQLREFGKASLIISKAPNRSIEQGMFEALFLVSYIILCKQGGNHMAHQSGIFQQIEQTQQASSQDGSSTPASSSQLWRPPTCSMIFQIRSGANSGPKPPARSAEVELRAAWTTTV
eukprot:9488480-Pyramimonas_sp.AAC.1